MPKIPMKKRKPDWLKIKLETGGDYLKIKKMVEENHLHTICSSGNCPNIGKCWSMGTATFMILGEICTRSCKFCATKTGKPLAPDIHEPQKVAESIQLMKLKHCVITSVNRDDLPDKGADFWAKTIRAVRKKNPQTGIEVLVPDFDNTDEHLQLVFEAKPDIFGHNLETVKRLTPQVRNRAEYLTSLDVLQKAHQKGFVTKSGIMVGLGETAEEVEEVLTDLKNKGCQMITIGQYLQPTKDNMPVNEYITPEQFEKYRKLGLKIGFKNIESAPLVRSSFMAERSFLDSKHKDNNPCRPE
jgi:lipoic acid synthetase